MKRPRHALLSHQLSRRQRRWLYAWGLLLLVSGSGWLLAYYGLRPRSADPDLPQPSEVWWLRLHGAALLGFLLTVGGVLANHVPGSWRLRLNRVSGSLTVAGLALLVVTGYGLYYSTSETWRARISTLHWLGGLGFAVILTMHAVLGRRLRRKR